MATVPPPEAEAAAGPPAAASVAPSPQAARRPAWTAAAFGAAAMLALTGCAGPTPHAGAYREQAAQTARSMVGILTTAELSAQLDLHGRSLGPFSDTTVSDAETDAGSVQTTFDSRQPPDPASLRLRDRVDGPLSASVDALQQLRIALRAGDPGRVRAALAQVHAGAESFDRLQQELSG